MTAQEPTQPASPEQHWGLACPHCSDALTLIGDVRRTQGLHCPAGHRFDAAKQGYVNLTAGQRLRLTPDSAEMIMARERVQNAGVFDPLTTALGSSLNAHDEYIVDCGAGTGHYLHRLLEAEPARRGVAFDISPAGLKRAAKHPRALALVWDLWKPLPLKDDAVTALLNVFAPRNPAEYARVLAPGGRAVVAIPRVQHLVELQGHGLIGQQADKREHLLSQMSPHFGDPTSSTEVTAMRGISLQTAADLVQMGPAGHHRSRTEIEEAVATASPSTVTVSAEVLTWTAV